MSILVSLIAGWFLNEMAKKLQLSRERRALIGRALANLLELHHQIRAVENFLQLFKSHCELSSEAEAALRKVIKQLLPQREKFVAGFEDAIGQLSESEPIIAFRMSTNAQIPRFLDLAGAIPGAEEYSVADMQIFESQLRQILVPLLEGAIKELARLHGKATHSEVDQMIDTPVALPEEILNLIKQLQDETNEQLVEDKS